MESDTRVYRCTDYNTDATAHIEGPFFVVHAGSKFGEIRNNYDKVMLKFREALCAEKAFLSDNLPLKEDERFLYADEAARIVTGCLVNESSWVAEDGSHPTLMAPPTIAIL